MSASRPHTPFTHAGADPLHQESHIMSEIRTNEHGLTEALLRAATEDDPARYAPKPRRPDPDYTPLSEVLHEAFAQAAAGKGSDRHARGQDFERQPICEISRMAGPGFGIGQAMKKAHEAMAMHGAGDRESAVFELLGAINYLAATVVIVREG